MRCYGDKQNDLAVTYTERIELVQGLSLEVCHMLSSLITLIIIYQMNIIDDVQYRTIIIVPLCLFCMFSLVRSLLHLVFSSPICVSRTFPELHPTLTQRTTRF